jgi:hypothetical protein
MKITWKDRLIWRIKWRKKFIKIWFQFHWQSLKLCKWEHVWCFITRKCPMCGFRGKLTLERANCAYEHELSNYFWACEHCHKEINAYYDELWDDYYSSIL